jgi:hypothetical protein
LDWNYSFSTWTTTIKLVRSTSTVCFRTSIYLPCTPVLALKITGVLVLYLSHTPSGSYIPVRDGTNSSIHFVLVQIFFENTAQEQISVQSFWYYHVLFTHWAFMSKIVSKGQKNGLIVFCHKKLTIDPLK